MKSLFLALGLILASNALPAAAQSTMSPAPVVSGAPMPMEHHGPDFDRAISNLQKIVGRLEHDPHDYEGHKVGAINALKTAITELEAARAVVNK